MATMNRTISPPLLGLLGASLAACGDAEPQGTHEAALTDEYAALDSAAPRVRQLALGRAHGCSLDGDISGLLCWGDNSRGQTDVPRLVAPRFVAAGGDVTCAIASGRVRCWGDNAHRQQSVPRGLVHPTQLAVGEAHVCALTSAGAVRCWGDNRDGQRDVPALRGVRAIAAGRRHSCALTTEGVRCWGDNTHGQRDVPELVLPESLAVGGDHSCVIDDGQVVCWGGETRPVLDEIPTVSAPTALSVGPTHGCVADARGVECWGDPTVADLSPRELTLVSELAVGGGGGVAHACARHQQGIACWGDNSRGQLDYDGRPLHALYRAEAEIAAPPELVWEVLMDLDSYPRWNPYTIAMESTLRVGDPMVMTVRMNPLLTIPQTEHIRVLDHDLYKACWGIETTTPALNTGERCQWLEPLPGGGTRYITEDLIEGTLNPLVLSLFDADLERGFASVARALKERAEALHRR